MRRGISHRGTRLAVGVAVAGTLLLGASPGAAKACEAAAIYLSGFPTLMADESPFLYYAPEDGGNVNLQATAFVGCGGSATYTSSYDTPPGSPNPADVGDYDRVNGTLSFTATQDHQVINDTFRVPIYDDGTIEPLAEAVSVDLSDFTNGSEPGTPSKAPLYIVDDEGAERARFVTSQVTVGEAAGTVRIPMLRAGAMDGGVSFSVSPGTDVSPASGAVQLAPDGRFGVVSLTVADDDQAEPVETIFVTLGGSAVEGGDFSLTITDNDGGSGGDTISPRAWFNRPRHGVRYHAHDLGSIEMFATDDSGRAAIVGAQVALRKKLRSGACKWWTGSRWEAGSCSSIRWGGFSTRYADGGREVFVETPLPDLTPSVGPEARVRSYRVYGRATDDSGNTGPLVTGENRNTFEITRD